MGLKVDLLRESFSAVSLKKQELTDVFYSELFKRYPSVEPLFEKTDLSKQKEKLYQALSLVIRSLDNPAALTEPLEELGRRHVGYGAVEQHYPAVGECLIYALKTVSGDRWRPEMEGAWAEAYGVIKDIMLKGAAVNA